MKEKRVRFKDSETEHPANCRLDLGSTSCEAREDQPLPAAASNEPKTSEFAFFKRLKQNVDHTSCQNPLKRESVPVRNFRRCNHARDLGDFKVKNIKSSQYVGKATINEIDPFLSSRDGALEDSAMHGEEPDNGIFKCSSVVQTPTTISLNSFLSATANASVNPESQQNDGDIFSSKRLKLLQQIGKTLFPEAGEVPRECDLVFLLLSRLLPESSQETLSQTLLPRQPESKEICQLYIDPNIQLKEATDTSRKLVKAIEDHSLDSSVSAAQNSDSSVVRCSYRMLLGHKEGNEQGRSLDGTASGWLNRYGDENISTLGNELYDFSTPKDGTFNILKTEAYKPLPYDEYDNSWSLKFKDQSHSYEVLDRTYNSFTAAKSSSSLYKDEIHDVSSDRRAQLSPNSWHDSCSRLSFKGFRPFALSTLRDHGEPGYLHDTEIRREPSPLLLGWDTNELDTHDSTHKSHMELELYYPPSTSSVDLQDSPELEVNRPLSTQSEEDHWDILENGTWSHLSPYPCQNHGVQGYFLQEKDLVPGTSCAPFILSYGQGSLNPDDSGLIKNISKDSSRLFIPQKGCYPMENMMCERNCSAVDAFLISQDSESDSGLNSESLTGYLRDRHKICTDNVLKLFGWGNSSSRYLIADEYNLAIPQPEDRSLMSEHVPLGREDSFPLLLQAIEWKDTGQVQTYDGDNIHWNNYL